MSAAALSQAILFATTHSRLSLQIFRNNCLVAQSPLTALTGAAPWNVWSSTKTVVAMLTGIAWKQGKVSLAAPIGRYLPTGMGDAAHRAITVGDLLTQTSGLRTSALAELATNAIDPNAPREALALPLEHAPGSWFEYSQRDVDLLAYVLQRALGEDLQAFAQRYLFTPIGIPSGSWFWLRDRSGHTYGFADLFITPAAYARLGLLLANHGSWNGRRVIARAWIRKMTTPTRTNPCYGYLTWLNHAPCVGPSLPSRKTFPMPPFEPMPAGTYGMIGFLQQNDFVIPSLHVEISWTGVFGDVSPDLQTLLGANGDSELYHDFFRILARAFEDVRLPDSGPYVPDYNLDLDLKQFLDPTVTLGGLGLGPDAPRGCTLLYCPR